MMLTAVFGYSNHSSGVWLGNWTFDSGNIAAAAAAAAGNFFDYSGMVVGTVHDRRAAVGAVADGGIGPGLVSGLLRLRELLLLLRVTSLTILIWLLMRSIAAVLVLLLLIEVLLLVTLLTVGEILNPYAVVVGDDGCRRCVVLS